MRYPSPQWSVALAMFALLAWGACADSRVDSDPCGPDASIDDVDCGTTDTGTTPDGSQPDASLDPWSDRDDDGVLNRNDNCARVPNPDQTDTDGDRVGDSCDNCPEIANAAQKNSGEPETRGDACDELSERYRSDRDSDGDGLDNIEDNCPETKNSDQTDTDGDAIGDACDNCPDIVNPAQNNSNSTDRGDACSPEPVGPVCRRAKADFKQFTPNVYFLLDKSGSMKGSKLNDAESAIVTVAQKLQNRARFGLTAFSSDCSPDELLEMDRHNAASVQESFSRVVATGETGTGGALATVRREDRFVGPSESPMNDRPKAIIVVTDGKANVCGGQSKARSEAETLRTMFDVQTFVVGFQSESSPSKLREIAQAGGTSDFVEATSETELERAAIDIFKRVIPCSFQLPEPEEGFDADRLWVEIGGEFIAPTNFEFDESSGTLTLGDDACRKLRNASVELGEDAVEITIGCPVACNGETEVCDYVDNDCDGEVDEGCEGCRPETCNGSDDDCDGETDEGCPNCAGLGEDCTSGADCCSQSCKEGTCAEPCRPIGVVCSSDGDCCSGICGTSGGSETTTCTGE